MKELNDFVSEETKKKAKKHATKDKEAGADDKRYISMMQKYKQMRRDPKKKDEANSLLDDALKLAKNGDVSKKAKIAAAYM
jgi:hypothetical protein